MDKRSVNLIPFNDPSIFITENILNVVIFVPLGVYAGVLFKRWAFSKKLLLFFLLSLIVEALQFILRLGAFDVTDLITNTVGGITGLMIFKAIEKAFNNSVRAQKFINLFAGTGTVLVVLLLVLLKMNMLPVRFQ
jgi:glycopeptide antibiotics resistance protein